MAQGDDIKRDYKNLLSLRMPVLGADREWHAIHRLSDVGVDTMKGIGFGEKGLNPLTRASLLLPKISLPQLALKIIVPIGQSTRLIYVLSVC